MESKCTACASLVATSETVCVSGYWYRLLLLWGNNTENGISYLIMDDEQQFIYTRVNIYIGGEVKVAELFIFSTIRIRIRISVY